MGTPHLAGCELVITDEERERWAKEAIVCSHPGCKLTMKHIHGTGALPTVEEQRDAMLASDAQSKTREWIEAECAKWSEHHVRLR